MACYGRHMSAIWQKLQHVRPYHRISRRYLVIDSVWTSHQGSFQSSTCCQRFHSDMSSVTRQLCQYQLRCNPSHRQCSSVRPESQVNLTHNSSTPVSTAEFLDRLDEAQLSETSPDEVMSHVTQLQRCLRDQLLVLLPWLQESDNVSYIQLTLSGRLDEFTSCIREHRNFSGLETAVMRSYIECGDQQLCEAILSLLYLGVAPQDCLIHSLLFEIRRRTPHMTLPVLQIVTEALKRLPRYDTITVKLALKRFNDLYIEKEQEGWNQTDVHSMAMTVKNLLKYLPWDKHPQVINTISTCITEDNRYLYDLTQIMELLTLAVKSVALSPHNIRFNAQIQDLTSHCKRICIQRIQELDDVQINTIYSTMRPIFNSGEFDKRFRSLLEERALVLLESNDCKIREISNLMFVIHPKVSEVLRLKLDDALYHNLDDIDAVTMSNIAMNMIRLPWSKRTLGKLQHVLATNMDLLPQYWKGAGRIVNMLGRFPFLDPKDQAKASEGVLRFMQQIYFRPGTHMAVLCAVYLLTRPGYPGLPDSVFDRINLPESSVGLWNIFRVFHMVRHVNHSLMPRAKHQLHSLQDMLHAQLLRNTPNITDLMQVCLIIHRKFSYLNTQRSFMENPDDLILLDAYMHMFSKLTSKSLDLPRLSRAIKTLRPHNYYSPQIMDNLTQNTIRHGLSALSLIFNLVHLLSNFTYLPKGFEELIPIIHEQLEAQRSNGQNFLMINMLRNLARLQYFPEADLASVFNLEFIENFDEQISKDPTNAYGRRIPLMQLNRFCVLECPQLDVPWFHEEFCRELFTKTTRNSVYGDNLPNRKGRKSHMPDEVDEVLAVVLPSSDHYRALTFTPYYYALDFECVLDEANEPVDMNLMEKSGMKESWQRAAIMILNQNDFCLNSKRLAGFCQTKIRHLELMGYKVIQIPHYEWYSMGLSRSEAKHEYIRTKIYS